MKCTLVIRYVHFCVKFLKNQKLFKRDFEIQSDLLWVIDDRLNRDINNRLEWDWKDIKKARIF